ncbi:nuclear transport factor 2 family protein [Streptomyces sp. 8K308]|nr:nuclear transport factor 2 family protein [Streptomyces sp. 8K308]
MPTTTVATLADRTEIADLFARLSRLLDEGRFDDAHTVYTDDVVVHSPRGGELRGLAEVTAHLHRQHPEGERTHHLHGDVLVTLDGDRASATANQLAFFYRDGEPPYQQAATRLTYRAVRTPAGWRFDQADIALTFLRTPS